jgi:hypothetical protein
VLTEEHEIGIKVIFIHAVSVSDLWQVASIRESVLGREAQRLPNTSVHARDTIENYLVHPAEIWWTELTLKWRSFSFSSC